MAENPLLVLLRKKKLAEAYAAARKSPALVNATEGGDDGETPFEWACRFGDHKTMRELLALGADVTRPSAEGLVPVELACDGSAYATAAHVEARTAMVRVLLAKHAPLGDTALELACSLGAGKARELVKLLVAAGARGDFATEGRTILHVAAEYDLPEALDYGLACGVPVDGVVGPREFDGGSTALHIAVKKRRTSMVERLVAAGAKVDLANKRKETPVSLANGALRKVLEGRPPAPAAKPKAKSEDPRPILERVWRSPRDPATLAVFADWLLLQGEATRGEYIGLALLPKPTPEQRARAERLRAKDRGRWLGEARKLVSEWGDSDTSPGFVAWATVSADNLLAHFDALRALGPELTLRLTPVKTRLMTKKLAQLPLGELHGLHFYNTKGTYGMNRDWLDDTSLGILSPALVGLRALVLAPAIQANEGEGFTPRALEHLRPLGATLASLTVDFSESDPTPDLLAALAPAVFPKLETLTIVGLPGARRRGLKAAWSKSEAELVFG